MRVLGIIPLLLGISLISFAVINLSPGGFMATQVQMSQKISPSSIERMRKLYGLDAPVHVRYLNWLKRLARFDLGESFLDGRPVKKAIASALPATILLQGVSLILVLLISLPLGAQQALRHGSGFDRGILVGTLASYSTPTFWLGPVLMLVLGVNLGWLPISGIQSPNYSEFSMWGRFLDRSAHLALPVGVMVIHDLAFFTRYMRGSLLEVIRQEYVTVARAKGLPEKTVLFKHAMRNALLPFITIMGMALPGLLGGGFIIETIFAWPGMGRLAYSSATSFDYPVIMGILLMSSFLTIIGNLLADMLYALVDPRVRIGGGQ